jgi:hypothetical protein
MRDERVPPTTRYSGTPKTTDLGNTVADGLRHHAMAASAGDGAGPFGRAKS